ncbi:hypothetical protein [Catenuloplanes atrovinosus]|uniref:Uncharacterized protein n=1 Tax=Catenuloplanes atrovinosus TaxID=137266 RepID=A0AAE3YTJ7_9ACTN|nr:hypothetical protein [Catenuloplanes atrovinosus]MDR7277626.1 hypothetical protein [Catenuloplanes atrovinosus]
MQPVLVHGPWQVETVLLDRGDGYREWVEVRRDDHVWHVPTLTAAQDILSQHGLRLADFTQADTVDDGCE